MVFHTDSRRVHVGPNELQLSNMAKLVKVARVPNRYKTV